MPGRLVDDAQALGPYVVRARRRRHCRVGRLRSRRGGSPASAWSETAITGRALPGTSRRKACSGPLGRYRRRTPPREPRRPGERARLDHPAMLVVDQGHDGTDPERAAQELDKACSGTFPSSPPASTRPRSARSPPGHRAAVRAPGAAPAPALTGELRAPPAPRLASPVAPGRLAWHLRPAWPRRRPGTLSGCPPEAPVPLPGRDQRPHGEAGVYGLELGLLDGSLLLQASHLLLGLLQPAANDDVLAVDRLDGRLDRCVGRLFQQRGPFAETQRSAARRRRRASLTASSSWTRSAARHLGRGPPARAATSAAFFSKLDAASSRDWSNVASSRLSPRGLPRRAKMLSIAATRSAGVFGQGAGVTGPGGEIAGRAPLGRARATWGCTKAQARAISAPLAPPPPRPRPRRRPGRAGS